MSGNGTQRRRRRRAWAGAALGLLVALAAEATAADPALSGAAEAPAYLLDEPDARELGREELAARPGLFPAALGERLEYAVSYLGVPVGSFSMEVARFLSWRGLRVAHVLCVARTNPVFGKLYPIFDQTESWIDLDSMRTLRSRSYTTRGRKETYYDLRLDWEAHYLHLLHEKRHKRKVREISFDFGPYVHDVIDLVYQLRRAPLLPGFEGRFPVYASRKVYEIRLEVGERARLEIAGVGRVDAVALRSQTLLDGELRSGGGRLWVGADGDHVPLRLEGWMGVAKGFLAGGVRAELTGWRAAAPGWQTPDVRAWDPPEWSLESRSGMPRWHPPAAIEAIRRDRGLDYRNVKRRVQPDAFSPLPRVAHPAAAEPGGPARSGGRRSAPDA